MQIPEVDVDNLPMDPAFVDLFNADDMVAEEPEERGPIVMKIVCVSCGGAGEVALVDDDGEPVVFASGKRKGEPKMSKCESCQGDGSVEAP